MKEFDYAWRIEYLFSDSSSYTLDNQISTISKYYAYLAASLDPQRVSVTADPEMIQRFEAVFLWLRERLVVFPDSLRQQVLEIEEQHSLCDLFADLSLLSSEELNSLRTKSFMASVFDRIAFWSPPKTSVIPLLTGYEVFQAKKALVRLSHILEMAADGEQIRYGDPFRDFKDHFDPDLIEKAKLIALVNYLKVQAKEISDEEVRELLTKKLDDLENKIRKPQVRWGTVLIGFFALCGYLADLAPLDPAYNEPLKTVQKIILVISEESRVTTKQLRLSVEVNPRGDEETESAEIPDALD